MQGLLIWIFGLLAVYLAVAEVVARFRYDGKARDFLIPAMSRGLLLSEIRRFLAQNEIPEEWLMTHGGEKEIISCLPGSIFGRCVTTFEFGQRQPFGSLELASRRQLRRVFARRAALRSYWRRQQAVASPASRSLAGQPC